MKTFIALAMFLAGCNPPVADPGTDRTRTAAATAPSAAPKPAAKPFSHEDKSDLIEFEYGWPAEAEAVTELARRFRAEMDKAKAELVASAEADRAARRKAGFPFNAFVTTVAYTTAGQSPRLLSLAVETWAYTGGAHGIGGTTGLLWDRAANAEIRLADLFAEPANRDRLLTQRWCDALNKAREEKRGTPVGGGGMFDECPALSDIAIIPTDKDGNGRFDMLMLVADPYVAGPYSEGSYEIPLAVTPDILTALKAEFRPSFEVQGRQ